MQSLHCLALSLACLTLYLTNVSADCSSATKTVKITPCIELYDQALAKKDERNRRIDAGNMTCPVDLVRDKCTAFKAMDLCMNAVSFPDECDDEITAELKNDKIECTYDELRAVCGEGSTIIYSVSLLAISLFVAAFRQL